MVSVILDCETDAIEHPATIHCIVCKELETGEEHVFHGGTLSAFPGYIAKAKAVIGHNIISFDYRVICELIGPGVLDPTKLVDTLILSQLLNYRQDGGHSLENWGRLLDHPKVGVDITDWSTLTPQMLERCVNDCRLNAKVYALLKEKLIDRPDQAFARAIDCEHAMAFVCLGMHIDGFGFDADRARTLLADLSHRVSALDKELLDAFPPKARDDGVVTPRLTKQGTISRANMRWYSGDDWTIFEAGAPFTRIRWEPFNPASPTQIVERLNEAGWKPTVKTESGESWKVNEENLATLPDTAPGAAKRLVERIMLGSRVRTLEEWLRFYNTQTGRVHGTFAGLGTWTHRMAHRKPNLGNVAAEKSIKYKGKELRDEAIRLGGTMRSLWTAGEGCWLVGTDMDAAHLRIFAHLIDDKELIEALTHGDKDKGTDPHTLNQRKLGAVCRDRDLAKTAVYSFLNGAGAGKFASIFACNIEEARSALDSFVRGYPGLGRLRQDIIPQYARRGFFQGLDGRLVACDSEHHMLACMLQNAEVVMMKHANIMWRRELRGMGIGFKQVNFVHDEWQTEVRGDRAIAALIGQVQARSIRDVGERFGLKCPMAGNYTVGKNWLETH